MLPDHAPPEYKDRAVLWNTVEKCERYSTAQLAREIEVALPVELTHEQNTLLVREYVQKHFVAAGMCADFALHDKSDGNPHAHILLTMRPIEPCGKWGQKSHTIDGKKIPTVDWNEHTKAEEWREGWATIHNAHMDKHGHAERIDHRSYERQGVDIIPTIKLGAAAHQMEKRGIKTDRGNHNRQIEISNKEIRQLKAQIVKLQKWAEEVTKEPTMYEVMLSIFDRRSGARHLQYSAEILAFLQGNKIEDMADFERKLKAMYSELQDVRDKFKPIERRIGKLDEHIRHAENHKKYRAIYKQYQQQKPKKKAAFYEQNRSALALFESADKHLKDTLNGRTEIPMKKWKAEREKLLAEKATFNQQYKKLKVDTNHAYKIKRAVEDLLPQEPRTKTRNIGMER